MARVLVVDDDRDGSEVLCRALGRAGHEAICFENGRDALASLHAVNPDAVVLDVLMPEMDGVEFVTILRMYLRGHSLPVIALTALGEGPQVERLRRHGVAHVFRKADYVMSDLLACIDQLTGAGRPIHAEPAGGSNWIRSV